MPGQIFGKVCSAPGTMYSPAPGIASTIWRVSSGSTTSNSPAMTVTGQEIWASEEASIWG